MDKHDNFTKGKGCRFIEVHDHSNNGIDYSVILTKFRLCSQHLDLNGEHQ